jgi:hypothetical protein
LGIAKLSVLAANGWYPQAIGTDKPRRATDKRAGKTARLFVHGQSKWEVEFRRPGEK